MEEEQHGVGACGEAAGELPGGVVEQGGRCGHEDDEPIVHSGVSLPSLYLVGDRQDDRCIGRMAPAHPAARKHARPERRMVDLKTVTYDVSPPMARQAQMKTSDGTPRAYATTLRS